MALLIIPIENKAGLNYIRIGRRYQKVVFLIQKIGTFNRVIRIHISTHFIYQQFWS